MSESLSSEPYKGVRDFYPADWAVLSSLFARIRTTLAGWGYEEYNASPLERAELYEAKTSEEIVSEQTYTFTDRGDRRVTLRPEMTPTLARMVAHKRRELTLPLRWFSIPNVFRYERPQRGRLREHYQLNVDLVGLPEGEADYEIITVASDLLKAFGASEKDFVIRVNSRALLNAACHAAGLTEGEARRYLRLLDKRAKMTVGEFDAARAAITSQDPLAHMDMGAMEAWVAALAARGVGNAVFDPGITRGFDYYTGIVFEVFDTNPANPRSLFGGGRYDRLVAQYGSDEIPAVGFGMGDVTLTDFLETHALLPSSKGSAPQLYLGTPRPEDKVGAEALAKTLRSQGCRVFVNLTERTLGDQVKEAVKRGIPLFVAYGSDEIANNTVRMKILGIGEEVALPLTDLPLRLKTGS